MDEDATTQFQNHQYSRGDYEEYPILIESDADGGNTYGGVTGEYNPGVDYAELNNQFMNTDFSLGSSSDSDYQPTGRPYVPDSVRRTARSTDGSLGCTGSEARLETTMGGETTIQLYHMYCRLSRYAVEEVNTEDKKKKRFMRGLNPRFKVQLRMMRATEFHELVDAAITLEDDFKQLQEEKRKKAKLEPKRFVSNKPNTGLSFKPRFNNNYNSRRNQEFQTANQIVCHTCGFRGHTSKDCNKPKIICFGCRQEGHMLKDCPKRKNGGGRSEEEETEAGREEQETLRQVELHQLGGGGELRSGIDRCAFDANLFVLPMKDIDVILGMNWLDENGALIDCANKTVSLKSPDRGRIIYQGDKHTQIEVELKLNSMKEVKLEDIPIVNEFQDVFPKELPGMPPDREIEFTIDLIPGTAPIAKAPYKMGPKELKELK
ncbi:hypothetical protein QYE76_010866 [Lolium multiflorum]|uniref:CCHC-type domain-containing protein n=1 Tax=Lolium multiflorum TaxID=4521 RepID=A0AAD8TXV9_LOLMU|nr:hypothetical protein QYE76_010866 [Lolium multiflorum]